MADERPNREFVEMLLEQDPLPDESRYTQHRQEINERLQKALRDEKTVRVVTIGVCLAACCCWLLPTVVQWIPREKAVQASFLGDVVAPMLGMALLACSVLAIPLLILYVLRYRRAVDRAREDARDAVLLELQEKVSRLSKGGQSDE